MHLYEELTIIVKHNKTTVKDVKIKMFKGYETATRRHGREIFQNLIFWWIVKLYSRQYTMSC